MSRKIPKAKKPSIRGKIAAPSFVPEEAKVVFSFLTLDRTEYFNLDATCANWSSELFEMLKNVSTYTKAELIRGAHKTYRVHNHENATPPNSLPQDVALKDFYQIRISKSKGGIHGVFYENVFYVIWFDPLHNMYPDDKHGGLRIITKPKTCCKDRDEIIANLRTENARLKEDCQFWEKMAANKSE